MHSTEGPADTSSYYPNGQASYGYLYFSWCIEGVGVLVIGVLGISVNLAALILLLRVKRRHIFHYLLISLCIYDLLHLVLSIMCFSLPQLSTSYLQHVYFTTVQYFVPICRITLLGISFTTVALTVERYISLCTPYLRYTHDIKPMHYILPVLLFSTIFLPLLVWGGL